MLTIYQIDMHTLADQLEGWDTPLGRTVCEARMAGSITDAVELARLGGYRKIADLKTNDPDVAYAKAQTITRHWSLDTDFVEKMHTDSRVASMSTGDILIMTSPGATTFGYLCTMDGWALMDVDVAAQFLNNVESAQ